MRSSDLRREENYNEYLRLLQDGDYVEVAFDEESGGMSAVHTQHKFSRQLGPWTICKKMRCAEKQNAECVVLFFPEESLYSSSRVREGLRLFQSDLNGHHSAELSKVLVVVQDHLIAD